MKVHQLKAFINELNKNIKTGNKSYIVFDKSIKDDMILDEDFSDDMCVNRGAEQSIAAIVPKNKEHLKKIESFLETNFGNCRDNNQSGEYFSHLFFDDKIGVYQEYSDANTFDLNENYVFSNFDKAKPMTRQEVIDKFLLEANSIAKEINEKYSKENVAVVISNHNTRTDDDDMYISFDMGLESRKHELNKFINLISFMNDNGIRVDIQDHNFKSSDIIKMWGYDLSRYSIGSGWVNNHEIVKQIDKFNQMNKEKSQEAEIRAKVLKDLAEFANKHNTKDTINIVIVDFVNSKYNNNRIFIESNGKFKSIIKDFLETYDNPTDIEIPVGLIYIFPNDFIFDKTRFQCYRDDIDLSIGGEYKKAKQILQEFFVDKGKVPEKMSDDKKVKFVDELNKFLSYINEGELRVIVSKSKKTGDVSGVYAFICDDSTIDSVTEFLNSKHNGFTIEVEDGEDHEYVLKQGNQKYNIYANLKDEQSLLREVKEYYDCDNITEFYIGQDKPVKYNKLINEILKKESPTSSELLSKLKEFNKKADKTGNDSDKFRKSCIVEFEQSNFGDNTKYFVCNSDGDIDDELCEYLSQFAEEQEDTRNNKHFTIECGDEETIEIFISGCASLESALREYKEHDDNYGQYCGDNYIFYDQIDYTEESITIHQGSSCNDIDYLIKELQDKDMEDYDINDLIEHIQNIVKKDNRNQKVNDDDFHKFQFLKKEFSYIVSDNCDNNERNIKFYLGEDCYDLNPYELLHNFSNKNIIHLETKKFENSVTYKFQDKQSGDICNFHYSGKKYLEFLNSRGSEKQDKYVNVCLSDTWFDIEDLDSVKEKRANKVKEEVAKKSSSKQNDPAKTEVKANMLVSPESKIQKVNPLANMIQMLKVDSQNAAYKAAAIKLIDIVRNFIINMVEKKSGNDAARSMAKFLDTEYGAGMLSFLAGNLITESGFFDEIKQSERFAKEFRITGMERFTGNIIDDILPEITKVIKSIPKEESFRVAVPAQNQLQSKQDIVSLTDDISDATPMTKNVTR